MENLLKAFVISALGATPVAAQSLGGNPSGTINLEYEVYDDGDGFSVSWLQANADLVLGVTDQFGVQLGFGRAMDMHSSDPFYSVETVTNFDVHGFYDVTPQIRLGIMYAFDTYNDGDGFYGVEGIYQSGAIRA